jgi:S-adenosyl methyltransferase
MAPGWQLYSCEPWLNEFGSGLPSAQNVHEVAQSIAPENRVVYVDHGPVMLLPPWGGSRGSREPVKEAGS